MRARKPTPAQIAAAAAQFREALAALHALARQRDVLVRAPVSRLAKVSDINEQIALKRADVKTAREALSDLLNWTP